MEKIPNTKTETIEASDWRERKEAAPQTAQELIEGIAGYDEMGLLDKANALDEVIDGLENNQDRFVAYALMAEANALRLEYEAEEAQAKKEEASRRSPLRAT